MPRLSGIAHRNLVGLIPKGKLTKAQQQFIEEHNLKADLVEYYFGRRCEYYKLDSLKPKQKTI